MASDFPNNAMNAQNNTTPGEAVDRAAASAHKLVDQVADKVGPAVEQVRDTLASATDAVSSGMEDLAETRRRWMDGCRTCVREHPLTAIGVAVAVGVLISCLRSRD